MNQPDSEILTLDEVAAYLKAGKKTVYRLAQQGGIPGFKLGGTWRFRRSELDRGIAAQITDGPPSNDLPPPPHRTMNLPQILAGLTNEELAGWPGDLADAEREKRRKAGGWTASDGG